MLRTYVYLVALFILLPNIIIIISSFSGLSYIYFPPRDLTLRWYAEAIAKPEFIDSFRQSIVLALITMVISTMIGFIACLSIRRLPSSVQPWLVGVIMSPVMLPTIILGIALLQFFALTRTSLSLWTLVIGHVVISIPYTVRLISDSLHALPKNLEWAAESLGASPFRVAREVVLPSVKSGLIAGALFAFIISFENITISIFLASPRAVTLPVRIYGYTESTIQTWLIAICSMTIIFTSILMWFTERTVGLRKVYYSGKG